MVRISKLRLHGFGRFANRSLNLNPGLNIIYGGNEAGKTTLHRFIEAMLFGFWHPYSDGLVRENFWEKYKPWQKGAFGGEMEYSWAQGNVLLQRDFATDSLAITDAESGDMITDLVANSWGEPDYARRHFGLSKLIFRNTVSISQLGAATDSEAVREIREMLKNLASSGGSGVSIKQSLLRLEAAKSELGTDDSGGKPLFLARELCQKLAERLEKAREELNQARAWELELIALDGRLTELQGKRQELSAAHQRWQGKVASHKLELLRGLEQRRDELEAKMAPIPMLTLPGNVLQVHAKLAQDIDSIGSELITLEGEIASLEENCRNLQGILGEVAIYQSFGQDTLIEMSSAWQLLAKGLQVVSELRQQHQILNDEMREATTALSTLPYFRPDVLEQAATLQKQAQGAVLLDSREDLTNELAGMERKLTAYRWGRGSALFLVPAMAATYIVNPLLALLALLPLTAFFLLASGQQRLIGRCRSLRREIYAVELEFQNGIRQREFAQRELAAILGKAGVKSFRELEEKYRLFMAIGERNRELQREHKFLTGKLESYEQEMMEKDQEVQQILRRVGLSDLPIEEALRQFRANLDRSTETETALARAQEKLSIVRTEAQAKGNTLENLQGQLSALYSQWEVSDGNGLEALVQRQGQRERIQAELEEVSQRCQDLLQGANISQLQRDAALAGDGEHPGEDVLLRLEQYDSEIITMQSRRGEISGRMEGLYHRLESPAAIQEELEQARASLAQLQAKRRSLDLAIATLEETAVTLSRQLAPGLNQRVSQIVKRIIGPRFTELEIDGDMNISVTTSAADKPVPLANLSGGTIDQIYFACRVAIADLVAGSSRLPLFLDDSFIQYDDPRLSRMLELLLELGQERQILLFTCQKREHQILSNLAPDQYTFINLDVNGG